MHSAQRSIYNRERKSRCGKKCLFSHFSTSEYKLMIQNSLKTKYFHEMDSDSLYNHHSRRDIHGHQLLEQQLGCVGKLDLKLNKVKWVGGLFRLYICLRVVCEWDLMYFTFVVLGTALIQDQFISLNRPFLPEKSASCSCSPCTRKCCYEGWQ